MKKLFAVYALCALTSLNMAAKDIQTQIKNGWEEVKTEAQVQKANAKAEGDKAMAKAKEGANKAENNLQEGWEHTKNAARSAGKAVQRGAEKVWSSTKDVASYVGDKAEYAWNATKAGFTAVTEKTAAAINHATEETKDFFTGAKLRMKQDAQRIAALAHEKKISAQQAVDEYLAQADAHVTVEYEKAQAKANLLEGVQKILDKTK